MNPSYNPFIDWLECLGITVILYGHLAGRAPFADLPPIDLFPSSSASHFFCLPGVIR